MGSDLFNLFSVCFARGMEDQAVVLDGEMLIALKGLRKGRFYVSHRNFVISDDLIN